MTRRGLIAGAAGFAGLGVAATLADRFGLVPTDSGTLYGAGATLTYAAQRLLTRGSLAREFPRDQISSRPFANGQPPKDEPFVRMQSAGFSAWRLAVDGMVARPVTLSLADLRALSRRSQITSVVCEEGWSYIAEWTGVPLAEVLTVAGVSPQARYVAYFTHESFWTDSIDMTEAMHPQTLIPYGMNGTDLPPGHGGPLRLRVPRQLGYKSAKYLTRITVTDSVKGIGSKGLGGVAPDAGYSWYAGI